MNKLLKLCIALSLAVGTVGLFSEDPLSAAAQKHQSAHKAAVRSGDTKSRRSLHQNRGGNDVSINENQQRRHGHAPFKEGDHVTFVLDENNTVIDAHLAGEEGSHRFVTGNS